MDTLPPPGALNFDSGNLCQAWRQWRQQFKLFLAATESDENPDKTKPSILLTCIGHRGREIYNTSQFDSDEDRMKVALIIAKFDHFCHPRKNITMLRHKFFIYRQSEGQRFLAFVTELRQLSEECDFGERTDSLIRDLIICGVNDSRERERMLREPELDLQRAIKVGQAAEETKQHVKELSEGIEVPSSVHYIKKIPSLLSLKHLLSLNLAAISQLYLTVASSVEDLTSVEIVQLMVANAINAKNKTILQSSAKVSMCITLLMIILRPVKMKIRNFL